MHTYALVHTGMRVHMQVHMRAHVRMPMQMQMLAHVQLRPNPHAAPEWLGSAVSCGGPKSCDPVAFLS